MRLLFLAYFVLKNISQLEKRGFYLVENKPILYFVVKFICQNRNVYIILLPLKCDKCFGNAFGKEVKVLILFYRHVLNNFRVIWFLCKQICEQIKSLDVIQMILVRIH
ncbi:MAG TPA: hypothetical protein DCF91_09585 [Porphyromonadaceae bacterium]|nr:hypothetical protein [Porphyromonadaceae bacterium]